MHLSLLSLWRVFMLLTALCLFGSVRAPAAVSCLAPHSHSGFTIQSGELRLNPETREVQWRGKVAKMHKIPYAFLENLILADGQLISVRDFEVEGDRIVAERGADASQFMYGRNWVSANIKRAKSFLNENFDPSVGDRIVGFYNRGFAWTTDKMLADAKHYDANKLTYLLDKQRLFKGPTEIILSHATWLAVDRFVNHRFLPIMAGSLKEIWLRVLGKEITDNGLSVLITRANNELMEILGTDEKVFHNARGQGTIPKGSGGWRMDPSFFDVK